MNPTVRRCLLLSLLLALSACGFSLRGSADLPPEFATLRLELQQPNSELARLLERSLQAADITPLTAANAGTDIPWLSLGNERISNRPVTVNPRARAAQYEIRVSVEVELRHADEILLAAQTLSVERSYFENIENIAGSQEEVEILVTEMRRELVNQLMRRLQAAAQPL